ncbi:hypothetical protein TanjilG_03161 [Lupinus angustifolius]|uniref:Uncharacterized protein n=1 Tax=Lupinus angustifolius TaxID=3871 RepID=A0A4P1RDT3_LUPAN|nr:hypothetical protein TanjilG_03161 [Lupinus angustifolius]
MIPQDASLVNLSFWQSFYWSLLKIFITFDARICRTLSFVGVGHGYDTDTLGFVKDTYS